MDILEKINKWDYAVLAIILVNLVLLVYRFDMFPKFVDIYYHFSAARAFELVNGIVLHDFWEYAPSGRPHLYPPFFHVLILMFIKLGLKIEFLLKIISLAIFPLLQVTAWLAFRKLFNKKTAFYIVLLLSSSYSFYWFETNMLPAALVIIFSIIIYYLIERNKLASASVLLALSLYTHLGLSLIIILSLIIYALLRKERLKIVFKALIISILLFLPWLIHILQNIDFLSVGNQANFIEWKLHFLLLFFAIAGVFYCLKAKKEMLIPISYALAMVPFLFLYPSIYFSGHNLFSWSMLGGVFLSNIDKIQFFRDKNYAIIIISVLVLLITPIITIPREPNDRIDLRLEKGVITNLIFYEPGFEDLNILNTRNLELADFINKNTGMNEIFYIGNSYIGGLVTTLTGRSQSGAMYFEVSPIEAPGPINAQLWISEISDPKPPEGFRLIKEINGYRIHRDDNVKPERRMPTFKIPLIYAYLVLIIFMLIIYFDLKKNWK